MHSPPIAPTSRIFEGFETIADQSLRPNERPKFRLLKTINTWNTAEARPPTKSLQPKTSMT